jgi:peroxiredoxin
LGWPTTQRQRAANLRAACAGTAANVAAATTLAWDSASKQERAPVDWSALVNGILVASGAFVALLFTAGGCLGWQLLLQNGRLLLRIEDLEKRLDEREFSKDKAKGLRAGSEAPAFELLDLAGKNRTLTEFRGRQILLIFFNPACGFCREMMPKLAALAHSADTLSDPMDEEKGKGLPLPLIITTGDAEANRQIIADHKIDTPVLLQKDGEIAEAYQANGTPTGYLIDVEGKIASELAIGAEPLLAMAAGKFEMGHLESETEQSLPASVAKTNGNGNGRESRFRNRSVAHSKIKRDGLKAGTPAPDFRLPGLDGRGELSLTHLRGRRVLLVFSSPSCGPCTTLAPQLEKFHREHPELEVVMISKGEPKENRAKVKEHGLTFPIVLQQQWEISRRYAMFATPIAYLIDEGGVVMHDVAVGTDAIIKLMGRAETLFHEGRQVVAPA